ncbi:MAG TPA: molybdopterin converting factor subunit 1 [Polyangiaceae bacterium]|nr:molybdopterin converting factor subunit 1 [Polyangiaceae bacterium]
MSGDTALGGSPPARRRVTVLYFGGARDAAGTAEESVDLPEGVRTVSDLSGLLGTRHPELAGRLSSVRFGVNEAFAEPHQALANGDVVAVIPPVSGG